MKKLMFALGVAAACGTVLADVTSANTVGYNTLDSGEQIVIAGCQFVDVTDGVSGVRLGDIKGNFVDFDLIEVVSCDEDGNVSTGSFTYFTEGVAGLPDGWYGDEGSADDERIPLGSAVWFTAGDEAKGITIAGQVYNGNYTHTFTAPISCVCSAFPVPFNPNDTDRIAWSGVLDFDLIEVASCDDSGSVTTASFTYFTEAVAGLPDGWYGDDGMVEDPITVSGQGFWLTLADPAAVTMIEYSPIK